MPNKNKLLEIIGNFPKLDEPLKKRIRIHQGWWRAFVLNEEQGLHPIKKNEQLCNTILGIKNIYGNFLSDNTIEVVNNEMDTRKKISSGLMEEERLFKNLLSSQPLVFNFWSELKKNKSVAKELLSNWIDGITEIIDIVFEYAYDENILQDNSAFDVAIFFKAEKKNGFLGMECKYTDPFSYRPNKSKINYGDIGNKNHDKYKEIYESNKNHFLKDYYYYIRNNDFNQLFRNELLANTLKKFDIVYTGLFFYHLDEKTKSIGENFKTTLYCGKNNFKMITYKDFLTNLQKCDIDWKLREWTMLLWTRYCGLTLSDNVFK